MILLGPRINTRTNNVNVDPNNVNKEPNNVNKEPNNINLEPNNVNLDPNNFNIDNVKNNNDQNNSANESLEEKKSLHSITQYVALNSENLNNMIIHIDDLATKYDKIIKSFNDTLINIQTNNIELANR